MRNANQIDGKVRTLSIKGINFLAQRKFFYCRAWDQCTASNYHCWKGGWVLVASDRETVLFGKPTPTSCLGGEAPEFKTKAGLIEVLVDDLDYYAKKYQIKLF